MDAEEPDQSKSKSNKKSAAKTDSVKRKNKGESKGKSCLLFLSKVAKKFGHKQKSPKSSDVIGSLLDEITNTLPLETPSNTSKVIPKPEATPVFIPEIIENITMVEDINTKTEDVEITQLNASRIDENDQENLKVEQDLEPQTSIALKPKSAKSRASKSKIQIKDKMFVMPHMPLTNSDVFKKQEEMRLTHKLNVKMEDAASNTNRDRDTAEEIHKHVDTLRKISIIADEFNKKTDGGCSLKIFHTTPNKQNMPRPRRYAEQRAFKELDLPKNEDMNTNEAKQPPISTANTFSAFNQSASKHSYFNGNKQYYATDENFNDSSEASSIPRSERRKWTIPEPVTADTLNSGFVFKYIHQNESFIPSRRKEMEHHSAPPSGFRVMLDSRTADTGVQSTPTYYVAESQTNPSVKVRRSSNAAQSSDTDVRSIACGRTTCPKFIQTSATDMEPLNRSVSLCSEACNSNNGIERPKRCPSDCGTMAPADEINTAYKYYTHLLLKQLHKIRSNLKTQLSISKCSCPPHYLCRDESGTLIRKDEAVEDLNQPDSDAEEALLEKEDVKSVEKSSSYLMTCSPACPYKKSKHTIVHTVRSNSAFTMRSQSRSNSTVPYTSHNNIVESLVRTIYIQGKRKSKIKTNEVSTGFVQTLKQSDHLSKELQSLCSLSDTSL